jgi:hypothetical protein
MSLLRSLWMLLGDCGRRQGTSRRKFAWSQPALETLEDRNMLATTILQTNLVSDLAGVAQVRDPNLVNP